MHARELVLEDDKLMDLPKGFEQRPDLGILQCTRDLTHEKLDSVGILGLWRGHQNIVVVKLWLLLHPPQLLLLAETSILQERLLS